MSALEYYTVLGVDRGASNDDIRRAYHRVAAANWSGITRDRKRTIRRLRTLKQAYAVLGDPARRVVYDATVAARAEQSAQPTGAALSPGVVAKPVSVPASPIGADLPFALGKPSYRYLSRSVTTALLIALVLIATAVVLERSTSSPTGDVLSRRVAPLAGAAKLTALPTIGSRVVAEVTQPASTAKRSRQVPVTGATIRPRPAKVVTHPVQGVRSSRPTRMLPPYPSIANDVPRRPPSAIPTGRLKQSAHHGRRTAAGVRPTIAPRHTARRLLAAKALPAGRGFAHWPVVQPPTRHGSIQASLLRNGGKAGNAWSAHPVYRSARQSHVLDRQRRQQLRRGTRYAGAMLPRGQVSGFNRHAERPSISVRGGPIAWPGVHRERRARNEGQWL